MVGRARSPAVQARKSLTFLQFNKSMHPCSNVRTPCRQPCINLETNSLQRKRGILKTHRSLFLLGRFIRSLLCNSAAGSCVEKHLELISTVCGDCVMLSLVACLSGLSQQRWRRRRARTGDMCSTPLLDSCVYTAVDGHLFFFLEGEAESTAGVSLSANQESTFLGTIFFLSLSSWGINS